MKFPTEWKNNMFQTTNQIRVFIAWYSYDIHSKSSNSNNNTNNNNTNNNNTNNKNNNWLVVSTPLTNISQLGWWNSQLNGKIKHVPNHQPDKEFYSMI